MLGHKLVQVLSKRFEVYTTLRGRIDDYRSLDLFDQARTFENVNTVDFGKFSDVVKKVKPSVIINAIGVIKQRKESKDLVKTLEINSIFPHKIARIAREFEARFITLSTDCVFDGEKGLYSEEDLPNALDLYGMSKNLGEVTDEGNCLTIRTSIIGREISTAKSLVEWFLNTDVNPVNGFRNAIYSGFPTIVLAEILADILENQKNLVGLYHISSEPINKFAILNLIKNKLSLNKEIEPYLDFKIDRSLDSTKFRKETNFFPEPWEKMIGKMLDDPTPYDQWRKRIS